MKKLIAACIVSVFFASTAVAGILPFGINGHYELKLGDIPDIAGTQTTRVEQTLSCDKEVPVGKYGIISVTPYLAGSVASEEFLNDKVLSTALIGVDVLVLQNESVAVKVGGAVERVYFGNDQNETRAYATLKVDF